MMLLRRKSFSLFAVLAVLLLVFMSLTCASQNTAYENDDGAVPQAWETGSTPKGLAKVTAPVVYRVNTPAAGNYPQGLYKYIFKEGDLYIKNAFVQTLEWFPAIHKTFLANTEYTAKLTLDPIDTGKTFKGMLQNEISGLPAQNVKSITAKTVNDSLVIYIAFNATESQNVPARILFEDTFTGNRLDTSKWNTSPEWNYRHGRTSWRSDMVEVGGGNLHIKFRRDTELGNIHARESRWNARYTREQNANSYIRSGGVRTIGTDYNRRMFEHSYGWYEARIKFPAHHGVGAAFWLMSVTIGSSGKGEIGSEIDILETIGNIYGTYYHSVHWNYEGGGDPQKHQDVFYTGENNVPRIYDGNFHVIALDWSPGEYVFYINGIKTYTIVPGKEGSNDEIAIMQNPAYMKLSAEAADWDDQLADNFVQDTVLVDYVRVYNQPRIVNQ